MPRLVLGPLLRRVDETSATVWVETDEPCEVEVLGTTARLSRLLEETAAGRRGAAPASVIVLAGDVHFSYLAEVAHRRPADVRGPVYQATCSPLRNPLTRQLRSAIRFSASRVGAASGRPLVETMFEHSLASGE